MPKENRFQVEYAKSTVSTCRACMAKIPGGSLRIGFAPVDKDAPDPEERPDGDSRRQARVSQAMKWHHLECFPRMKGVSRIADSLPPKPDAVEGFDKVKPADRKKLRRLWTAMKGTSGSKAGAASGGKRRAGQEAEGGGKRARRGGSVKQESTEADEFTSPRGVLTPEQHKNIQAEERRLASAPGARLSSELLLNKQVRTGPKDQLVSRVAEGRVLGALPICPRCKTQQIHWSRQSEWYSCPGYFDKEKKTMRRCNFRTKELKREKWRRKG